eukprot:CAMPEP_0201478578 /NCGR_PEP_ID=MMETSP0151_2-20130828/3371_1 /ASSEMBLY_ACC=CAM_ASM_000257 /TAXON_ID=200890 /ORGANISM="Paramoeba atlantica, Strain 621/1 / CCAP 1560/9" /LENGTH=1654 /DNA_ID=CAMNT_0047859689 /DNA_START=55 /DNA_END=5019 /DNA_ORIENTATION=-
MTQPPLDPSGNLPPGWQVFHDDDGHPFYYNPSLFEGGANPNGNGFPSPSEPKPNSEQNSNPYFESVYPNIKDIESAEIPFPPGWEVAEDETGRKYYIDHINQITTWEDPRESLKRMISENQQFQQAQQLAQQSPARQQQQQQQQPVGGDSQPDAGGYPPPDVVEQSQEQQQQPVEETPPEPPEEEEEVGITPPSLCPLLEDFAPLQTSQAKMSYVTPSWDVMEEEQKALECANCSSEFSFFKQKQQCGCCYRSFCALCTTRTHPVQQYQDPLRVCDVCYQHLVVGDKRCISRLVPYLTCDDVQSPVTFAVVNEILEIFQEVGLGRFDSAALDLTKVGILKPLMDLLTSLSVVAPSDCLIATLRLLAAAATVEKYASIFSSRCIPIFESILNKEDSAVRSECTKALALLCQYPQGRQAALDAQLIPLVCNSLGQSVSDALQSDQRNTPSTELSLCLWSVKVLCTMTLDEASFLLMTGAVSPVGSLLACRSNPQIARFSTFLIFVLSLEERTRGFVDGDVAKNVVELLGRVNASISADGGEDEGQMHSELLKVLLNLSSDSSTCAAVVSAGGTAELAKLLGMQTEGTHACSETLTYTLSILLKLSSVSSLFETVIGDLRPCVSMLMELMESGNAETQQLSMLLVAEMSSDIRCSQEIRAVRGIDRVVRLLSHSDSSVQQQALHIAARLSQNDEENALALLNSGGLMAITSHVQRPTETPVQIEAVRALAAISGSGDKIAAALLAVGGVQSLVGLMGSPLEQIREGAACALANLCRFDVCKSPIIAAGGVTATVSTLSSLSQEAQESGLRIIQLLSTDPRACQEAVQANALPELVGLLTSPNENIKGLSSYILLTFARDSAPNRQAILSLGGVPAFVSLLRHHDAQIKIKSAEVISIFSNEEMGRHGLRGCSGVSLLVECLKSSADLSPLQLHCTIALFNLTRDSDRKNLEALQREGVLVQMLQLLKSKSERIQEIACSALMHLAESSVCRDEMIGRGAIDDIALLLRSPSVSQCAVGTLSVLSDDPRIGSLCEKNDGTGLGLAIQLLASSDETMREHTVRVILNTCEKSEKKWDTFVKLGGLNALLALAASSSVVAQVTTAREISRVAKVEKYCKQLQTQSSFSYVAGLFLSKVGEIELNIVGAVSLLSESPSCAQTLIQYGAIGVISNLMNSQKEDVVFSCVKTLHHICGIDKRYSVSDKNVCAKLVNLLFSSGEPRSLAAQILSSAVDDQHTFMNIHEAGGLVAGLCLMGCDDADSPTYLAAAKIIQALSPLGLHKKHLSANCGSFTAFKLARLLTMRDSSEDASVQAVSRVALAAVSVLTEKPEWCAWVMGSGEKGKETEKEKGKGKQDGKEVFVNSLSSFMSSSSYVEAKMAVDTISRLCSHGGPPAKAAVISSGALRCLSEMLKSDESETQGKAAEILAQLSSVETGREMLHSVVPVLLDILKSRVDDLVYLKASEGLRFLLLSDQCRNEFCENGGVNVLLQIMHRSKTRELVIACGWLLYSLSFSADSQEDIKNGLTVIVMFLSVEDDEMRNIFLLLLKQFVSMEGVIASLLQCGAVESLFSVLASNPGPGITQLCLEIFLAFAHDDKSRHALHQAKLSPPSQSPSPSPSPSSSSSSSSTTFYQFLTTSFACQNPSAQFLKTQLVLLLRE